jgi:hypothetical protein
MRNSNPNYTIYSVFDRKDYFIVWGDGYVKSVVGKKKTGAHASRGTGLLRIGMTTDYMASIMSSGMSAFV